MTKRSNRWGIMGAVTALPGWLSRRRTGARAVYRYSPPPCPVSCQEIRLDDGFRVLLANALIARHRARIAKSPELLLLRETWDADGWARAEADQLVGHIRAAMEYTDGVSEGDGQRIPEAAVT